VSANAEGFVVVDGRKGAEEQAADIGESGGAANGDAIAGEDFIKFSERMVDALGGLETVRGVHQLFGKVGVLLEAFLFFQVLLAQFGWVGSQQAALASAAWKPIMAADVGDVCVFCRRRCEGFYFYRC